MTKPMDSETFYRKMHDENIMLTFKGEATYEVVSALLSSIEPKIHVWESDMRVRKRLYSVLVECLQNMVHHGDSMEGLPTIGDSGKVTLLLLTSETDSYCVHTGNCIGNKKIDELKEWLDTINVLSPEEIKSSYKKILDKGDLSDKGTAGLGFLDIARKSGQKFSYQFQRINNQYSVFSFSIKIPKQYSFTPA
jgi:Family of unknown function (DUF6272)